MDHVAELVRRASKVTIFMYNHVALLSWLRKKRRMDRDSLTWCNPLCYYIHCTQESS